MGIAIAIFLVIDFCVAVVVVWSLTGPLREFAKELPAQEPAAEAPRRGFQSFKFGILNAGWSFHVAVDDRCLHLSPSRFMRLLGLSAMSIPWDRIRLVKRGKRWTRVRVEGTREKMELKGPTWCLELAAA